LTIGADNLPSRMSVPVTIGGGASEFVEWGRTGTYSWPKRTRELSPTGGHDEIEWSAPVRLSEPPDFTMPKSGSDDFTFSKPGFHPIEAKRSLVGLTLVKAQLGGHDGWFILDTGAGGPTVVGKEFAKKLKKTVVGHVPLSSVVGMQAAPVYRVSSFEVGPMQMENPAVVEMDFSGFGPALADSDGIIGFDLFMRCLAEIEVAGPTVRLAHPSTRVAGKTWTPLVVHRRHPSVRGKFRDGALGVFNIDIGMARGTVIFHSHAANRIPILAHPKGDTRRRGLQDGHSAKIEDLILGKERFDKVTAYVSHAPSGPMSDPYSLGTVGTGLLSKIRFVLDMSRERIAIERIAR
ncbi:MAG TPA: retropepsin-like aspartic protease, partial [Fimbriimonadaceae bacterium]|nr:retropepsin-like aspartic protease [Fimbriimonadaceae bacterium]